MKRILALLFVFAALSGVANAHGISSEESLQKALSVMHSNRSFAKAMGKNIAYQLVATERAGRGALYYVFESNGGGFIITGADHRAHALLGYADEGSYEDAMKVPGFQGWLAEMKAAMAWLSEQEDAVTEKVRIIEENMPDMTFSSKDGSETLTVAGRRYAPKASLPEEVLPLLENIKWNQTAPYNGQCPKANGVQCVTGCVATATAQIMKYYEWPQRGTGSNSYTTTTYGLSMSSDFSQSTYDWANMLDDYSGGYSQTQGNAVAKLMSDIGVSVYMDYGPSSGASEVKIPYALSNYFSYNKSMQLCYREYFTAAEWNDLLKDEIASGRPVLMCGTNYYEMSAHAFVLDGYNTDGLYHVNWGWGGVSNGYFDINYMNPSVQGAGGSNGGYPGNQNALIGVTPDTDGTSVAKTDLYVSVSMNYNNEGLTYGIVNYGQKPFSGKLGFAAIQNGEIIKTILLDTPEMGYAEGLKLQCELEEFGFTLDDVKNEDIYVYPIVNEDGRLYVPTSQVAYPAYRILFDYEGNVEASFNMEDMPSLSCENPQVTRAYQGYDVKLKADIRNAVDSPTYDRYIGCYVYDSDYNFVDAAFNFKFIEAGTTKELEFNIPKDKLRMGETYNVWLVFQIPGGYLSMVPGSEDITFTLQSTGGQPDITYSNFEISKHSIQRGEELTASMKATNTGGFFVGEYYCFVFSAEGGSSLMRMPVVEADVANGSVTISTTAAIDLEPGEYMTVFYLLENGALTQVQTYDYAVFTVTNVLTDIDMVTEHGAAKAEYYDIMGRKVTGALKKGIYISNGKKVLR